MKKRLKVQRKNWLKKRQSKKKQDKKKKRMNIEQKGGKNSIYHREKKGNSEM